MSIPVCIRLLACSKHVLLCADQSFRQLALLGDSTLNHVATIDAMHLATAGGEIRNCMLCEGF